MKRWKKIGLMAASAGGLMAASITSFAASIVDFSTAASAATTELTGDIPTVLPFFGTLVAVGVAFRVAHKAGLHF